MTQEETIDNLSKIKKIEDIKKLFPNSNEIFSKLSHLFVEIEPKHFAKFYYKHKDGRSMFNVYESNTNDINHNEIDVQLYYTGTCHEDTVTIKKWEIL